MLATASLLGVVVGVTGSCAPKLNDALPQVILKLDDAWFEQDSLHPGWVETFAYLNERNVRATIGVVGERMEGGNVAFFSWLKRQANHGHEVWNHGYCHCKPQVGGEEAREFRGTSYGYQLEHLQKTQDIAAEKMGLRLQTFGAPYNACDANTTLALAEIPELTTWLYPPNEHVGTKFPLPRVAAVNIEYPVHEPDFDTFVKGFRAHKNASVLVIQGHPRSWMKPVERLAEFRLIVDFLLAEGVRFTTPTAYRISLNG